MRFAALCVALLLATPLAAQDYSAIVASLDKAVLRVAIQKGQSQGSCTAVIFDIVDGRAHALTAAHCVAVNDEALDFTVGERSGKVELSNRLLDLAIVTFRAGEAQTVPLAPVTPAAGTPAFASGYAFGVEGLVHQFGHVAQKRNQETKLVFLNIDLIFGDSGGPIFDAQGRMIGITSAIYSSGPAHLGGAVSVEQVHDFLEEWRDVQKAQAKK